MHFLSRLMVRPRTYQDWSIRIAQLFLATNFMAAGYTALIDFGIIAPDNQLPAGIVATLPDSEIENLYDKGMALFKRQDYEKAFPFLHSAAWNGHLDAQYRTSFLYSAGFGVEHDDCLSVEWSDQAARMGYARAQVSLANELGGPGGANSGLAWSAKQRLHWILEAAQRGDPTAQESLANGKAFDDWFLTESDVLKVQEQHHTWKPQKQEPVRVVRLPFIPFVTREGMVLLGHFGGCSALF
ncbi:tetratricopeptide repeat protein [Magnetospira sp. QH-2]|uniref:tetratricopeptide repeat protein n=1 Tax=Magnetospira sp. (strain QH-2) TaxID=1288970 RepID=UPI0003E80BB3|nr:sel1 repeat family protein [Magnetospira sp. QH-2]CCQ72004.1 protein of unknown function (contains TPR repeats) [Magnetospira sp. QH-2]